MNVRDISELEKEQLILDYLEGLLHKDKKRLLRMMSYLKDRILEEEAMARAQDVIERVRHG